MKRVYQLEFQLGRSMMRFRLIKSRPSH